MQPKNIKPPKLKFLSLEERKYVLAWIRALDSGKYLQARSTLQETRCTEQGMVDAFCCLGLLQVKIHGISAESHKMPISPVVDKHASLIHRDGRVWALPSYFADKVRARYPDTGSARETAIHFSGITTLDHLNDNCAFTFPMIADVLREAYGIRNRSKKNVRPSV